jgi:hypothetical protein
MSDGEPAENEIVYSEKLTYEPWLWLMILGLIALYIAVLVGAVIKGDTWIVVVFTVIAVALVALMVNFRVLVFSITSSEVVFGFGLVKKSFPRADIKSCEVHTLEFRNYYGFGIRSGRDGTIAYNTRNGRGIKLVVEGHGKPYVVSVKNPEHICKLLSRPGGPD